MKKNSNVLYGIIALIIIIVAVIWYKSSHKSFNYGNNTVVTNSTTTALVNTKSPSVSVSETTKVSGKLSEYHNAELGFAVKYPVIWEKSENDSGVTFVMPIDQSQVSTVGKLQADISVYSGKCAFPPVTTIKDRSTVAVGSMSFNMISMSNNVQGSAYFNRMYSLQQGPVCYLFSFASITKSPTSKNLTGSNLTQAQNNNKAIINTADASFTDMVKTFAVVKGPQGVDDTKAAPAR